MSVLVVVTEERDIDMLLGWSSRFARASDLDLRVLIAERGARSQRAVSLNKDAEGDGLAAKVVAHLRGHDLYGFPAAVNGDEEQSDPCISLKVRVDSTLAKCALRELGEYAAQLLICATAKGGKVATVATRLIEAAHCATLVLRKVSEDEDCNYRDVLVPASSGSHVRGALNLAKALADAGDGAVTALYVEPEGGEDADEVGLRQIEKNIARAKLDPAEFGKKVIVKDSVVDGISAAMATGDYDLLLIGASDKGVLRKLLFGNLAKNISAHSETGTIGIYRSALPVTTVTRRFIGRWLSRTIPQLEREDRITLFDRLQNGSLWNFDFVALISLSTSIAALGLILSSTAVVIGAMLVAPLMTPMLGAGLGLVQGNIRLVRNAFKTIVFGFSAALFLGGLVAFLSGLEALTPEMAARGAPNLLDLAVAILSGIAAAYASARPGLSAALPGVAIAAALVPPIATAGAAAVIGEVAVARGAATLFATNFVAIVLGAAVTLYAVGARPAHTFSSMRVWVRRTLLGLAIAVATIALPLGTNFFSTLRARTPVGEAIRPLVEKGSQATLRSWSMTTKDDKPVLEVVVRAGEKASEAMVKELSTAASKHLDEVVEVRVVTELVTVSK
jgi:uncharacterized hydrophobic protein (TIGR00271 family)